MHFSQIFDKLCGLECSKGFKKVGCPVVSNEEIIAMFGMKMSQIDTENDKKPKNSQLSKILCIFRNFDRLHYSER